MYRFIFWNVGIFFAALIILFSQSCRKQDLALQPSSQEVERTFFKGSNNAGKFVSRLADTLKTNNRSTPFIVDLALEEGMAIWDKAMIEINEQDTLCFLPLVQINKKYVNSFLLFKVNNRTINTTLIQGGNYNKYGVDENWVVIKFMQLNTLVFGETIFEVTSPNVLNVAGVQERTSKSAVQVRLATEEEMEEMQSGTTPVPSGIIANRPMATIVKQKCSGVVYMQNGVMVSYQGDLSCATTIVLDPQPGTPVIPTPTTPPPTLPGMPPPTGGCYCIPSNPGLPPVKPVIINNIPPIDTCAELKEAGKKLDSLFVKSKADSVLATITTLATDTIEKGFPIYKNIRVNSFPPRDTTYSYSSGDIQIGTDTSIRISTSLTRLRFLASWLHTHPPKGYAAHSAADVYDLIEVLISEPSLQCSFVAAANGDQYAITISNKAQAEAFFDTKSQYLQGRSWNENSTIGKAFEEAKEHFESKVFKNYDSVTQRNLAYEMAMAAVLSLFNTGVTLHKKDSNGNFKPLIVKTVIPNPNKPKRKQYVQDCL